MAPIALDDNQNHGRHVWRSSFRGYSVVSKLLHQHQLPCLLSVQPPSPRRPTDSEARHVSQEASGVFLHKVWEPLSHSPLDNVHASFPQPALREGGWLSGQHDAVCFGWWSTEDRPSHSPSSTGIGDGAKCMWGQNGTPTEFTATKCQRPSLWNLSYATGLLSPFAVTSPLKGTNQSAVHIVLRWRLPHLNEFKLS